MRILQFSDVHLSNNDVKTEMVMRPFLEKLERIHRETPIDMVVFCGDMLLQGWKDEKEVIDDGYDYFVKRVIDPLLEKLHFGRERFFMVMGNHDLDRNDAWDDEKEAIKATYKSYSRQGIADFYTNQQNKDTRASWVEAYRRFIEKFYKDVPAEIRNRWDIGPLQSNYIIKINDEDVVLSCFNSSWGCITDEQYVLFGKHQINASISKLREMERTTNIKLRISVSHHPFTKLSEQESSVIRDLLSKNYELNLFGHTHKEDVFSLISEEGASQFVIAPELNYSSLESDDSYRNGFSIITYKVDTSEFDVNVYKSTEDGGYELTQTRQLPLLRKRIKNIQSLFDKAPNFATDYLSNNVIDQAIADIDDAGKHAVCVVALSGFGKTRMLYECFKKYIEEDKLAADLWKRNKYYCEYCDDKQAVLDEIDAIIERNGEGEGLLILDNCSNELCDAASEKLQYTRIRLVAVTNDPFGEFNHYGVHYIILPPDVLKEKVDSYIDTNLLVRRGQEDAKNELKNIVDGNPWMATELVKTYNEAGKNISITDTRNWVRRMLKNPSGCEINEMEKSILTTLSLLLPFPTYQGNRQVYEYVIKNSLMTHIDGKNEYKLRGAFDEVIRNYSNTFIEKTDSYIKVRPFPLVFLLYDSWCREMSVERMIDLINDISQQKEYVKDYIIKSMSRRVETLQGSSQAIRLMAEILKPTSSFFSEEVVCSGVGSRLFLAMATVNPSAGARYLKTLFASKDTEWIRTQVVDEARRNLVWALSRLCFHPDSYDDAIWVLAKFAMGENEYYSNNAEGYLCDIFQTLIPGTSVSLDKRYQTILQFKNAHYDAITIRVMDRALQVYGHQRMCGAERMGWKVLESYVPDIDEIERYQLGIRDLLLQWMEEDKEIADGVAMIIEHHVLEWREEEFVRLLLLPLLNKVGDIKKWRWPKMQKDLMMLRDFKQTSLSPEIKEILSDYIKTIEDSVPFAEKLSNKGHEVYALIIDEWTPEKYNDAAQQVYLPMVHEFIVRKLYCRQEEVDGLLISEYTEHQFVSLLRTELSDDALQQMVDCIWDKVQRDGEDFVSAFYNIFMYVFRDKACVHELMRKEYENGYMGVYARSCAAIEDESMAGYRSLFAYQQEDEKNFAYAERYINALNYLTHNQLTSLLRALKQDFPDDVYRMAPFIIRHRLSVKEMDGSQLQEARDIILDYAEKVPEFFQNYEYIRFAGDYMEHVKDVDFAKRIHLSLRSAYNSELHIHNPGWTMYEVLLANPEYQDAIWPDMVEGLTEVKYLRYYFQIQYEIGSGFGFGQGPLFQYVSDERLKELCGMSIDAANKMAGMAPVFAYAEEKKIIGLSPFLRWMIDSYGEHTSILEYISANMNSFSWTGSSIPLYQSIVKALTPLLTHPKMEVAKWAAQEIKTREEEIRLENAKEDFMRMHYSM
jgi:predicted phosphodiesterase/CRISPR/Cas system CSM-associated protein Csm2 small subunit